MVDCLRGLAHTFEILTWQYHEKGCRTRRRVGTTRSDVDPRQCSLSKIPLAEGHVWQHRFYDFVVFTEKKRVEKLRYMHRNPVVRGLVPALEEWNWSSYRHYALGERGPVLVNEAQKAEMRLRGIA
jgi:hypothetical protein